MLPMSALALEGSSSDDIVVLCTNDIHTYIDRDVTYSRIAALKKSCENVPLADADDHIQGTVYGALDNGETIIELMNTAGYDLAALGKIYFWSRMPTHTVPVVGVDDPDTVLVAEDSCTASFSSI